MLDFIRETALMAGALAKSGRERLTAAAIHVKDTPTDMVTDIDREVERFIIDRVRAKFPDHGFIGEETGGWNDFYGFATKIPAWLSLITILPLTFGIATLLRLGHNKCCQIRRDKDTALFKTAYTGLDLRQVITEMALAAKKKYGNKSLVIPSSTIGYMIKDSGSDLDPAEGCRIYFETLMKEA